MNFKTYAKIDNILINNNKLNHLCEYNYNDILLGAEDDFVGVDAPLYKEYSLKGNNVLAFHDDMNGYVKFEDISKAAEDAFVFEKPFDLQRFVSHAKEQQKYVQKDDIQVRILRDGKVINGELKKRPIIPIINIKPSPAPGKTMILVELPKDINSSKYIVTVLGKQARYINNKFVITVDGKYTVENVKKIVVIEEKKNNDNLKANIKIVSSPAPGKTIVIITLLGNVEPSKYSVKIGDMEARFVNGKFVATVDGIYTEDEINKLLNINLK